MGAYYLKIVFLGINVLPQSHEETVATTNPNFKSSDSSFTYASSQTAVLTNLMGKLFSRQLFPQKVKIFEELTYVL